MKWLSCHSKLCASYKVHLVKQCDSFSKINVTHHCKTGVCPETYLTVYYRKFLTWRKMYFTEHCKILLCCEIHKVKVLWNYISDYSKEWTFCKITAVITAKREHAVKLRQWLPHRMKVLWSYISDYGMGWTCCEVHQWLRHRINVLWSYISDYCRAWICLEIHVIDLCKTWTCCETYVTGYC
jgi:hypothetical protein